MCQRSFPVRSGTRNGCLRGHDHRSAEGNWASSPGEPCVCPRRHAFRCTGVCAAAPGHAPANHTASCVLQRPAAASGLAFRRCPIAPPLQPALGKPPSRPDTVRQTFPSSITARTRACHRWPDWNAPSRAHRADLVAEDDSEHAPWPSGSPLPDWSRPAQATPSPPGVPE